MKTQFFIAKLNYSKFKQYVCVFLNSLFSIIYVFLHIDSSLKYCHQFSTCCFIIVSKVVKKSLKLIL